MRLRAIEEFADLGSGFNIAMRDLEIRGAGNLVGAQQHGFIAAVGFDLYCRLLDEAMREIKGEYAPDNPEPEIKIAVSAYIPDEYLRDPDQKMEFYQRLADAGRIVDLLDIREEMQDRFGRLPQPARSLMHIMEIKIMARQLGLASVQLEQNCFRLAFPPDRPDRTGRHPEDGGAMFCPARLRLGRAAQDRGPSAGPRRNRALGKGAQYPGGNPLKTLLAIALALSALPGCESSSTGDVIARVGDAELTGK